MVQVRLFPATLRPPPHDTNSIKVRSTTVVSNSQKRQSPLNRPLPTDFGLNTNRRTNSHCGLTYGNEYWLQPVDIQKDKYGYNIYTDDSIASRIILPAIMRTPCFRFSRYHQTDLQNEYPYQNRICIWLLLHTDNLTTQTLSVFSQTKPKIGRLKIGSLSL